MCKHHRVLGFCLTLAVLLVSQPASAALIYNLVDHGVPGHTLTGTITVTDTAPDDGELSNAEVFGWEMEVIGSNLNFDMSSTDTGAFLDIANMAITPTQILIQDLGGGVNVSSIQYGVFVPLGADLEYFDQNDQVLGASALYRDNVMIESRMLIGGHVHATIVPEPTTALLLASGLVGFAWTGRRRLH